MSDLWLGEPQATRVATQAPKIERRSGWNKGSSSGFAALLARGRPSHGTAATGVYRLYGAPVNARTRERIDARDSSVTGTRGFAARRRPFIRAGDRSSCAG